MIPRHLMTTAERDAWLELKKAEDERAWAEYETTNRRTARAYWHYEHGARHCYCGRRISAQIDVCPQCAKERGEEA